jgi:formamidopyrimidine-DNA glycosylase
MPEIPELEAIREFFAGQITGRAITSAETRIPIVFRTGAANVSETIPGDTFDEVVRHGKFLLFSLASGRVLAINPMLAGRFQYVDKKTKPRAKTCLVVDVDGGRQVRYSDERVMGKIYLLPEKDIDLIPGWTEGGPDLMAPDLTEEVWLERLKKYRGRIKGIITKAEFVQGIGNAYSDEILWEAKINPYTPKTELTEGHQRELFRAARRVMEWATPLVKEAMVEGDELNYEERRDFMRVHRLGGEGCPRCESRISEITVNRRVTSFCRTCQPGGPAVGQTIESLRR